MLGLPKGKVYLVEWNEEWENCFNLEKEEIIKKIGRHIILCHHIGSTAIKGLSAKPIIDIAIEINNFNEGYLCVDGLVSLGYKHRIIPELPDRHYFSKGELRTHQIHMFPKGSIYLKKQIAFRDCLIKDKMLCQEYQKIKETLSTEYSKDKLAYSDSKTDFINKTLEKLGFVE